MELNNNGMTPTESSDTQFFNTHKGKYLPFRNGAAVAKASWLLLGNRLLRFNWSEQAPTVPSGSCSEAMLGSHPFCAWSEGRQLEIT